MRASLLASATAATRSGFLAFSATIHSARAPLCLCGHAQHRGAADDEHLAQVSIALLGDRSELFLSSAGALARRQAQRRGEVAPGFEYAGIGKARRHAEAISGPMAGISCSKRLIGRFALAAAIVFSNPSIFISSCSLCQANRATACLASSGRPRPPARGRPAPGPDECPWPRPGRTPGDGRATR